VGFSTVYKLGDANLMATWERNNGNTVPATGNRDKNTVWHIGANYETGPSRCGPCCATTSWWPARRSPPMSTPPPPGLVVAYKTDAATTLTGAIYHVNVKNVAAGKDADPTMYVARYRYALSKRTDLHVTAAYAKAKNGQLTGLSRDDAGFMAPARHAAPPVGMQHRF
jgi:predicted porin